MAKPMAINAICLNKYTSVLPLYILYASEPVALYTTSNDTSTNKKTVAQITLSPLVLYRKPRIELCMLMDSFISVLCGILSFFLTIDYTNSYSIYHLHHSCCCICVFSCQQLQTFHCFFKLVAAVFVI